MGESAPVQQRMDAPAVEVEAPGELHEVEQNVYMDEPVAAPIENKIDVVPVLEDLEEGVQAAQQCDPLPPRRSGRIPAYSEVFLKWKRSLSNQGTNRRKFLTLTMPIVSLRLLC